MPSAAFQSVVNVLLNLGVIGDVVLDEPYRAQPVTLDSNGGSLGNFFIKNAATGIATQGGVISQGAFSGQASLSGTTVTVTSVTSGALSIGQTITGTGIPGSTTIVAYGTGAGGTGTYTASQAMTTEGAEAITGASGPITVFGGIAVNPKIEPFFGSSATSPLYPSETLQPNAQAVLLTLGSCVVTIPNNFNIGDTVTYNSTTGVLGSVAPGGSLPSGYALVPNCVIYGAPSQGGLVNNTTGGGLCIIRLTN